MKYAIDRYGIGIEKEVSADEFDGQYYIPGRRNRFYCPECGEIVFFRAKGGSNPNHFFHQEKTDRTPECDRRVDGRSSLSLSERVGLPIYLTTLVPGSFQINVGFPAIGAEMLKKADSANCVVEISFGERKRIVKVDSTHFIEDEISLIPVNFVPKNGRNYAITISGDRSIYGLQRKWSDYADGFDRGGAIFTYEESSGKKVRRGDSISTHRSYFVVTKNTIPHFTSVRQELVGALNIDQESYNVYKVEINVSIDERNAFSSVSNYFRRNFGVWLLECAPELIPIWPPVIQNDCYIPVTDSINIVCAISSGNAFPAVYVYSDYGVSNKEILDHDGVKFVEITLGKRPITLSVDRKYVGREITFYSKSIPESCYHYEIGIGNLQDRIDWSDLNEKILSSEFQFFSNCKMEIYAGSRGKIYRHIPIRKSVTIVPAMKDTRELYLIVESTVIQQVNCINVAMQKIQSTRLIQQFQRVGKCQMVPIPQWADHVIRSLKKNHNEDLLDIVRSNVENGEIPIRMLNLLRMVELQEIKQ